jgi:predicted MFS family arabinose efflux permease
MKPETSCGRAGTAREHPDGSPRFAWDPTFAWFLLLFFLFNVGLGVFPPLLPQIMEDLGLSFASTGLLGTAFGLFRFLVDLPAGYLLERLGPRIVLHGAAGLLLLGTAVSAVASSFWAMFLARAMLGTGSGMAMVFAILYLMRRGADVHRNRRANLYELSVIAGMAVSSQAAGIIAGNLGWRQSFAAATGMMVLAWIAGAWGVLPGVRDLMHKSDVRVSDDSQDARPPSLGSIVTIYMLIFAQAFAWGGGISTLLPLYGGEGLRLTPEAIGRSMAIAFWAEVCLLFPVGWAADVWGKTRVVLPGFLAMLVGTLAVPLAQGVWGYGIAFTLLVGGMSVWMAAPALLAEQLPGGFRGKGAGLYRLVTDLGFIVAPGAVGWLIGASGFATGSAVIAAVLVAAIVLSLCYLRSPRPHR